MIVVIDSSIRFLLRLNKIDQYEWSEIVQVLRR